MSARDRSEVNGIRRNAEMEVAIALFAGDACRLGKETSNYLHNHLHINDPSHLNIKRYNSIYFSIVNIVKTSIKVPPVVGCKMDHPKGRRRVDRISNREQFCVAK